MLIKMILMVERLFGMGKLKAGMDDDDRQMLLSDPGVPGVWSMGMVVSEAGIQKTKTGKSAS